MDGNALRDSPPRSWKIRPCPEGITNLIEATMSGKCALASYARGKRPPQWSMSAFMLASPLKINRRCPCRTGPREYAAGRDWTIAMQVKEGGFGASQ